MDAARNSTSALDGANQAQLQQAAQSHDQEQLTGYLPALAKEVTVEPDPRFKGVKESLDKHSKDLDSVPVKTRAVRLPKEVKVLLQKAKKSWIGKQLAHAFGSVKRKAHGQNWKEVSPAKMEKILSKLSDSAREGVRAKLEDYNAAVRERKELKAEMRKLEKSTLNFKYDYNTALEMWKAGSSPEIPHSDRLIVAFPNSKDGKQKKYIQLCAGSDAGNLSKAREIGEDLKKEPSFQNYLAEREQIQEKGQRRDELIGILEGLSKEIPGMGKADAKQRADRRKYDAAFEASEDKKAREHEIDVQTDIDYSAKETKMKSDQAGVQKMRDSNTELGTEVETVQQQLDGYKNRLKIVSSDLAGLQKTKSKVSEGTAKADINTERLAKEEAKLKRNISQVEKRLSHLMTQFDNRQALIKGGDKTVKGEKAELKKVYKKAEQLKTKEAKKRDAQFREEVQKIDKDYKQEKSEIRTAVTGRPPKEDAKASKKADGSLPSDQTVDVSDKAQLLENDQLDQEFQRLAEDRAQGSDDPKV